jgi:hypothetical protein
MKRIVTLLLAVGGSALLMVVLMVGIALAAPITIDAFDEGEQNLAVNFASTLDADTVTATSGILGTERDVSLSFDAGVGLGDITLRIDRFGASNVLAFNEESQTEGSAQIQWDGEDGDAVSLDTTGLGGVDLTDGGENDGFQLLVIQADAGFDLTISVYSSTQVASYTIQLLSTVSSPGQSFFVPFTSFNGAQSVFTSTGAVTFDIDAGEDTDLTIDLIEVTSGADWGDLPESPLNYPTSLANNGPRHVYSGTPAIWLGPQIDLEANGFPSANADGDDTSNFDDEDGIVLHPSEVWSDGATVHLTATVTGGPGELYSWWDWNNDGYLSDETVISWTVVAGDNYLALVVPVAFNQSTPLYARYRLVPPGAGNPGYTGEVDNGEVEDYRWTFTPNAVVVNDLDARPTPYWWVALAAGAICLAGLGGGLLLLRRKRVL